MAGRASLLTTQILFSSSDYHYEVGISISTENGYTDQATVPTAGGSSHTFNIPKDEGKWVQVCVNSRNLFVDTCHTYEITGSDMSVSLYAK